MDRRKLLTTYRSALATNPHPDTGYIFDANNSLRQNGDDVFKFKHTDDEIINFREYNTESESDWDETSDEDTSDEENDNLVNRILDAPIPNSRDETVIDIINSANGKDIASVKDTVSVKVTVKNPNSILDLIGSSDDDDEPAGTAKFYIFNRSVERSELTVPQIENV
jgi:hypothetical protein